MPRDKPCLSHDDQQKRNSNSSLSATILDYYNRYGQHRDLEKFLRFRRCGGGGASDDRRRRDSSDDSENSQHQLPPLGCGHLRALSPAAATAKSLENLHILRSAAAASPQKSKSTESLTSIAKLSLANAKQKSKESLGDEPPLPPQTPGSAEKLKDGKKSDDIKVQIKNAHKSKGRKSWNWNMESNIEISFAQPAQPLMLCSPPLVHQQQVRHQEAIIQAQLQQQQQQQPTIVPKSEFPATPLRPLEKQIKFDVDRPASAASSSAASGVGGGGGAATTSQRLEWDSMADVGYDDVATEVGDSASAAAAAASKADGKTSESSAMSSFERETLRKFFAIRGLSFDEDNIVVFGGRKKVESDQTAATEVGGGSPKPWEIAFQRILEEKHEEEEEEVDGVGRAQNDKGKALWKSALEKFRAKYGTRLHESDLCITRPDIHSTPNAPSTSLIAPSSAVRKSIVFGGSEEEVEPILNRQFEQLDRSCQTSLINLTSKGCQAHAQQQAATTSIGTGRSSGGEEETDTTKDGGIESVNSFEFLPPSAAAAAGQIISVDNEDKENIPPPPEDDKENIPPILGTPPPKQVPPPSQPPARPSHRHFQHNPEHFLEESAEHIFQTILSSNRDKNSSSSSAAASMSSTMSTSMEQDIQKGVDLLNALVDSQKLDKKTKKRLVRKIVHRLLKANRSTSAAEENRTIETAVSGVTSLSSSTATDADKSVKNSEPLTTAEKQPSSRRSAESSEGAESMRDWLKPMTHAEFNYEQQLKMAEARKLEQTRQMKQLNDAQEKVAAAAALPKNDEVLKIIWKERNSQVNWIQNEIDHLVNLKELLMGDDDANKKTTTIERNVSPTNVIVYENLQTDDGGQRVAAATTNNDSSKSGYVESICSGHKNLTSGHSSSSGKAAAPLPPPPPPPGPSILRVHSTQNTPSSNDTTPPLSDWNSHINMQKIVRNRTKLETPPPPPTTTTTRHAPPPPADMDLSLYARTKSRDFIEKYQHKHARLRHDRMRYTEPYSSDHYSEPNENRRRIIPKVLKQQHGATAYTTASTSAATTQTSRNSSSDQFLSSDSVSLPPAVIGGNSTSNTTTHQYDAAGDRRGDGDRLSVAIQTGDSLRRQTPIFARDNASTGTMSTRRIRTGQHNKQQQTVHEPLAFQITFNDRNGDESPPLTLREQLQQKRPGFVGHADERRQCLLEIAALRQRRNEQREKLFLLSSNNRSLQRNMKYLNPPPMRTQRVFFSSKHMKEETHRRYQQLPEVLRKEENDRLNKIKRSNRIVTNMFNRGLQKRVLNGRTDLSNSMTAA